MPEPSTQTAPLGHLHPSHAAPVGGDPDLPSPEEVRVEAALAERVGRASLDSLIARDPKAALERVQARIDALSTIRKAALTATSPNDWTLNRDKEGHVTATLRRSGAEKVRKYYGISVAPHGIAEVRTERIEKPDGSTLNLTVAEISGDAFCGLTGECAPGLVGRRVLGEKFTGRDVDQIGLGDLKSAARTCLDTKATRILAGLSAVTVKELADAWGWKAQQVEDGCYRGHGFGSSEERRGGGAAVASGGAPGVISDKQQKLLWAKAHARSADVEVAADDIMRAVLATLGVAKTTDVPITKMDEAIRLVTTFEPAGRAE